MKYLVYILIILLTTGGAAFGGARRQPDNAVEARAVYIKVATPDGQQWGGSGTILSPGVVLTAGHVCGMKGNKITLGFRRQKKSITTKVYTVSRKQKDLCVVLYRKDFGPRLNTAVAKKSQKLRPGDILATAGFPLRQPTYSEGYYIQRQRVMVATLGIVDCQVTSIHTNLGASGSGVYLQSTGELVGVVSGMEGPERHMFMIPVDTIRSFLEKTGTNIE